MREGIHPEYSEAKVVCSCGESFTTRSTKSVVHIELCSMCHPFYTGKQKLVDTGGRVERFQRRTERSHNEKKRRIETIVGRGEDQPGAKEEIVSEDVAPEAQSPVQDTPEEQ